MRDETYPISKTFPFIVQKVDPFADLSQDEISHIERIWEEELRLQKGHLFNGQLFSVIEINERQLIGRFVPYKLYIAQLRLPALKKKLQIFPMSITGLTQLDQRILIGKRSKYVTQYPGCFELVPSGGVDDHSVQNGKINLVKQFQIELQEEAGIGSEYIETIDLKAIKYNATEQIYEVCADIKIKSEFAEIVKFISHEHEELNWVPIKQMEAFMALNQHHFVPFSWGLLLDYKLR